MFKRKRELKYKFKKSYISNSGTKLYSLTIEYQNIFKKVLNNGIHNLNEKEKIIFFKGLSELSKYISNSLKYNVFNEYDNKPMHEKILIAIFYRISKFIGSSEEAFNLFQNDFSLIAENSIYLSLGIDKKNNRNYLWDPNDLKYNNFIKHTITKVFNPLVLEFLQSKEYKLNNIENREIVYNDEDFCDISVEDLLKNIKIRIPKERLEKIKKYLSGEISIDSFDKSDYGILEHIYGEYYK